ncbi:MAG: VCBS repeat-containing protein [Gemmatimonadota bacterium]|nr:MAG: VCBS repeat-containing protein [Gemmatimonadota bacterium]
MPAALPRRKRQLLLTVGLGLAFLFGTALLVWRLTRPEPIYRPGEAIEGLTAGLERTLPEDYPRVRFADVSEEVGIRFRHFSGSRSSQLPEDMGSGAAWGDYDNDGWLDLYVANMPGPLTLSAEEVEASPAYSVLYHNNGDGTFTEVGDRAGVRFRGWAMGVGWGDYDNDGWLDLVVTAYGENALYHNNGDGTFTERAEESGLGGLGRFWAGASWGDYDRDGFLDLHVAGYVQYDRQADPGVSMHYDVEEPASINPSAFPPERNLLYRNNGNGTFAEVAVQAGVSGKAGRSLEAVWVDFDRDGWPDLYVANDVSDNVLYRNEGDGTFRDISHPARVADYRGAMGIAVGDWNADAGMDMVVTHWMAQENALYTNLSSDEAAPASAQTSSSLRFRDEADRFGLGQIALDYIGWGTSFFDYDNDGRLDLFVANGSTLQQRENPLLLVPMPDQLFWNRGAEEGFYDVSSVSGEYFQREYGGRGAAFGDYDNDGDVDVFIVNNGGPGILLRNEGGNRNRWLQVRLEGRQSNRSAIGARLRLVAGGTVQIREVGSQASYLSQNSLTEHFGLGAGRQVDTLEVLWPSGSRQVFVDVAVDQLLGVVEGEDPAVSAAGSEREQILRFWELYREATEHRVAGRTHQAASAYERALELKDDHENSLYYLGNMYMELGEHASAEAAWRRLVQVGRSSARAHARLGDLYRCPELDAFFDLDAAEAELRRALQINREDLGPLLQLGEVAILRGDTEQASGYFDAVLGSDASSVDAHFFRGYIAWKRGETEQAHESFARAVDLARPAQPADGMSREGDTRAGSSPLVTSATRCGGLRAHTDDLEALGDSAPIGQADASYRRLDRYLDELRRKPGS